MVILLMEVYSGDRGHTEPYHYNKSRVESA